MRTRSILTGSEAAAFAAKQSRPRVVSAYPITPQTGIIEKLSEYVASGELAGCQFVPVESEHSALALLNGAAQAGVRTFTATSSHGLLYMHEMIHWVAGARLPIVMVNVNRAIGSPWNIACDRTDSLSQRDTGWIQLYAASNQEVYDLVLLAYRIAEASLIPVMVCFDGFLLSHTKEPVATLADEIVDTFLPVRAMPHAIDPSDPKAFGAASAPEYYWRLKRRFADDLARTPRVFRTAATAFTRASGRAYHPVDAYRTSDAEIVMVAMGSTWRIVEETVDQLRMEGIRAGAAKLTQFRPFPDAALRAALAHAKKVIALDVNQYAIIYDEIRSALSETGVSVFGYTAGVGGVPIGSPLLLDMFREALLQKKVPRRSLWRGVAEPESAPGRKARTMIPIKSSSPYLAPGHRACVGCTASLTLRHVLDVLGARTQIALPASCWSIIAGPNPYTPVRVPLVHCPFETAAVTAGGLARAASELGRDATALAFAGDGGTFDIGLQALSGAAERGEDVIYICYDNEAYMNTGGQRSSSTPRGAATETTPYPNTKPQGKKNMMKIMAAHGIPYAATASIAHADDFRAKLEKANAYRGQGLRFIHVLAPCNPGWKIDPGESLRMAHLAVASLAFPLVECDHGKWRITHRPDRAVDLAEYICPQGRFAHLTDADIALARAAALSSWEEFEKLERYF